jgi:hypothetical protein
MNKAILASYGRAFLATCLAALFATGKLPTELSTAEWLAVANSIWVATIPVIIRWLNPNDPAFGRTK